MADRGALQHTTEGDHMAQKTTATGVPAPAAINDSSNCRIPYGVRTCKSFNVARKKCVACQSPGWIDRPCYCTREVA